MTTLNDYIASSKRLNDVTPQEWDAVNKPEHYNLGKMEAIEYIKQQCGTKGYMGYLEGNVLKYMHRWKYKSGVQDLEKAQWYLQKLVEIAKEGGF